MAGCCYRVALGSVDLLVVVESGPGGQGPKIAIP